MRRPATRNQWIGKFDGQDYPVPGVLNSEMKSYKQVQRLPG